MEESRKPMSQMELKTIMSKYRRFDKYSEEILQLISEDLLYGLTKEEVEVYLKKGADIHQMRVISTCMKNGYPNETIAVIAGDGMSGQQMAVALEFYEKGISLELIEEVMKENPAPYGMKVAYQRILDKINQMKPEENAEPEYVKSLLEEIKNVVSKIDYQEKRYDALNEKLRIFESTKKDEEVRDGLVKSLGDKDQMINSQQDLINQANATIARLRNELEENKKELGRLQNQFEIYKKEKQELQMKEGEMIGQQIIQSSEANQVQNSSKTFADDSHSGNKDYPGSEEDSLNARASQIPYIYGIPMLYQASFINQQGQVVTMANVEKQQKKANGVISLISKIGIKKKSRQDIVKLVANGELDTSQLIQIRYAIEKGLTEKQLIRIINSKAPAENMKEYVEIAVLENKLGE